MPADNEVLTAPAAAEGSSGSPTQTETKPAVLSRPDQIRAWMKPPEPEKPADKPAEEAPAPAEGEKTGEVLSQPPEEAAPTQTEEEGPAPTEDQSKLIRRIRALKDQKRTLKADVEERDHQVRELRQQLDDLRKQVQPKQRTVDFSEVSDREELAATAAQAAQVFDWADSRLDRAVTQDEAEAVGQELVEAGFPMPDGGWTVESVRKPLRQMKANSRETQQAAQLRAHYLATEEAATTEVARLVPELADENSELAAEVQDILKQNPWLKQLPQWSTFAVAGALGSRELQRRRQPARPAVVPAAAKPVSPPKVPGAPARPTPAEPSKFEQLQVKARQGSLTSAERVEYTRESLRRMRT